MHIWWWGVVCIIVSTGNDENWPRPHQGYQKRIYVKKKRIHTCMSCTCLSYPNPPGLVGWLLSILSAFNFKSANLERVWLKLLAVSSLCTWKGEWVWPWAEDVEDTLLCLEERGYNTCNMHNTRNNIITCLTEGLGGKYFWTSLPRMYSRDARTVTST